MTTVEHLPNGSQREQWTKSLFHFTSRDRKRPSGQLMSSIGFSIVNSEQKNKVSLCIGLVSVCTLVTFGGSGGGCGGSGGLGGGSDEVMTVMPMMTLLLEYHCRNLKITIKLLKMIAVGTLMTASTTMLHGQ